jgi:hypothetical protein
MSGALALAASGFEVQMTDDECSELCAPEVAAS